MSFGALMCFLCKCGVYGNNIVNICIVDANDEFGSCDVVLEFGMVSAKIGKVVRLFEHCMTCLECF